MEPKKLGDVKTEYDNSRKGTPRKEEASIAGEITDAAWKDAFGPGDQANAVIAPEATPSPTPLQVNKKGVKRPKRSDYKDARKYNDAVKKWEQE